MRRSRIVVIWCAKSGIIVVTSVVSTDQPSRPLVEAHFSPVIVEINLNVPNRFRRVGEYLGYSNWVPQSYSNFQ